MEIGCRDETAISYFKLLRVLILSNLFCFLKQCYFYKKTNHVISIISQFIK